MKPGDESKPVAASQPAAPPGSRTRGWNSLAVSLLVITMAGAVSFVWFRAPDDEYTTKSQRIEQLQVHLKNAPDDAAARMQLAAEYSKHPELALNQLRRIPAEAREYPAAQREVARLLFELGDYRAATDVFERLQEASPDDGEIAALGAQIHLAQRHVRTAQNLARRSVALEPERPEFWLLLAEIYQKSNKDFLMMEPLEETLKRDPDNYQAHLLMAIACHARGKMPEAIQEAVWCQSRRRADVRPVQVLAEIARDEGQFELAEQYVQAALKLDPRDVKTRIVEADLLLFRRQPELAYQRLSELRNDGTESMFRFVGALERAAAAAGKLDEAKKLAKDLERLQDSIRPPASEKRSQRKPD